MYKVIEKLMHNRLINYIEKQSILKSYRFGFRSKHSTIHALLLLADKIQTAIDKGVYSCGIILDLSKHLILLTILYYYLNLNIMVSVVMHTTGLPLIALDEAERILILPLLAGSGLMLSCFENFRTGDRLKMPRLHATVGVVVFWR